MEEIWKDIEGYEGLYQVSTLGRVKGLLKIRSLPHGGTREYPERIMKQKLTMHRYYTIELCKYGTTKCIFVHRLVALAFIPVDGRKEFVNHKNGIKNDNRVDNLEWCTASENLLHSVHVLNNRPAAGADNNRSRAVLKVAKSGEIIAEYGSLREAATMNKTYHLKIKRVASGLRESYDDYTWKYKDEKE